MTRMQLGSILAIAALSAAPIRSAQAPAAPTQHPTFAGEWAPSEPSRSNTLFDVGLGLVPGSGRLIIEQRPDRLSLTKDVPDDRLTPILGINGMFYKTVIFRIAEPGGRAGGFGAGGDQRATSWQGARLVLTDSRSGSRPFTLAFSLDGDRLKLETHVEVSPGRENNVTEWFTRVK